MPVTNYKNCKYHIPRLQPHIYIMDASKVENKLHIDYRTITLDRIVSNDVIKINGNTISLEEETSLDERYRFSKSLSISIDGYYAIENLEKKYFIVVEDYHKNQFLVNYDFPCRVTYNYTIDDNDNRTTFNFDVLSNFPLVRLNHNLSATSEQLHCRYWIGKPHKIKMIEKDYVVLNKETKEIAISNNETFKEIEPLTFNFLESFDGNDFNTNISFTIPLDDYKSYWQYSLLEFTKNRYSMIIEPLVGENNIYVGFGEFGLMANYSISTDGDNIVTILLQTNERCYANEPFESYQDGQTFWIPISSVTTDRGEYMTSFECSSTDGYAKYLLIQEIDAFGRPTGNYKALEGYEEDYNHFINIIGTFDDEILFKHDDCKFKCQTISNIPNVIVFSSVASYTYTISSLCPWTIDNSNLPSGVTVSPLSGGTGITNITISCTDVGASEGNYSIVLHTQDEDIPSTISVRLSKDEEYYAEIDARRQNVDFNTIFPIEYLYGDITRIIDFNVIENYIKFDIPRNDSTEERIFNIVAEDIYGSEITFHILQYGIIQEWREEDDDYVCVGGDLYSVATLWTGYTSTSLTRTNETKPYSMSVPRSEECEQYSMWQWNGDTICIDGNLYQLLTLMVSSDGYEWRETEETMTGDLIEESSLDCAQNIYEINVRTKDEVGSSIWTTIVVRINGGEPMNYVNVSACTFNVAEGAEYEILFADKPNYFKPDTITATATEDKTYDAIYTTARQYNVGVTTVDEQRNYVRSNITLCMDGQCRTYQGVSAITFSAPANTEFEISFSDVQGYSTPQPIITSVTADVDYIAVYGTPKSTYDISVSSNMACDITINNVTYNNVVATSVTINSGDSYVISFSDIQGYAKPSNITGIATSDMSYSVEYTEIINTYTINVTTTDENSNPIFTRIGVAINGHAQTYPNVSGLTFNVNEGDDYIITYFAKEGYIAPSVVSVDSAISDASYIGIYQKKAEKFQIIVNPNIECDITVTINGSSTQYEDVKPLYIYLDSGDTYVIEFGEKHGYVKPSNITGIANGNKIYNVNYSELPQYTLNVYTNINTTITINGVDYVGTSATTTLYSGDSYSVSFASVSGYLAPSSVSGTIDEDTNINATYQKTYVLSVTSNMATDITINGTTYRNVASTSVTLVSGSSYSVSFAEKEGYYTPSSQTGVMDSDKSISVEYVTILEYTLSVSSNMSCDITINGTTYSSVTATSVTMYSGSSYSVLFSEISGYVKPSNISGILNDDVSYSVEYRQGSEYTMLISSNLVTDVVVVINGVSTTYNDITTTSLTLIEGDEYEVSFETKQGYYPIPTRSGTMFGDLNIYAYYQSSVSDYLNFTARNGAASVGISLRSDGQYLYYSFDKISWSIYNNVIHLSNNQTVWFKGNLIPRGTRGIGTFSTTRGAYVNSYVEANGSVQSLIYDDNYENNLTIPYSGCFKELFANCAILKTPPQLPATSLTEDCYGYMFSACTSLDYSPQLPATTLEERCYARMFTNTGLKQAPQLPATTLKQYCYQGMFADCANLIEAPQLPATTLANGCYSNMFNYCRNLQIAPQLPAITLTEDCYGYMFSNCSKLNYIKMLATDISADFCLYHWVYSVASSGTFVKNSAAIWDVRGVDGVPNGWTIEYETVTTYSLSVISNLACDITINGTTYQNISATSVTMISGSSYSVSFGSIGGYIAPQTQTGVLTSNTTISVEYVAIPQYTLSVNSNIPCDITLNGTTYSSVTATSVTMYSGTSYSVSFSEISGYIAPQTQTGVLTSNTTISVEYEEVEVSYLNFTATNGAATIGMVTATTAPNISYSTDKTNWTTWDYSNLTIPNGSTIYMKGNNTNGFSSGSGATSYNRFTMSGTIEADGNVQSLLYGDSFESNLTIPNDYCFYALFSGCTSLTTAPQLLATSLTIYCYESMFRDCSNLVTPPTELPATTLRDYCYADMFNGCSSLTTAPIISATTLATYSCAVMFFNCSSLTTAPLLNARTLVNGCYKYMFQGCSSLNYIKAMFTTNPTTTYTQNWVSGVAASGTYVKNSSATYTTRGVSAIPNNWTIQTASS